MRIVPRSVIFLCFINLVCGLGEVDDIEREVKEDSEWWSKRITKINRVRTQEFGILESEDSERRSRKWEVEDNGDQRRRPRPFASPERTSERRLGGRFESQRLNVRINKETGKRLNLGNPEPSPILLPPYASPSPVLQKTIFDNNVSSLWKNESSNMGKSRSAVNRIRIYEITTFNSTNNEAVESKPNYTEDSSKIIESDDENRWRDFVRETSINITKTDTQQSTDEIESNLPRSFYIDEDRDSNRVENTKPALNRSNPLKTSRGNRKYHHDFESDKSFMRNRMFSSSGRNDWRRRPTQRSNHFKFRGDPNSKNGAVPGVPGRDYPVHQEHTHHNLRNVADRFPCPQTPQTHVYLADRASRCQIFYVCYGSKTGVPMVCPNGTLFSEFLQVCDWWFNVQC